jgi:hypothetical protein
MDKFCDIIYNINMANMAKIDKKLFWDVKFKDLDYKKHVDFIIKRILELGDVQDYQFIQNKYGRKKIKEVAQKTKFIHKKNANFWKLVFSLK